MNRTQTLTQRIRASREYHLWSQRNRTPACFSCHSPTEPSNVHHVTPLYHLAQSALALYQDLPRAYSHLLSLHSNDLVDNVTLCHACHNKRHSRKSHPVAPPTIRLTPWCAVPRILPTPLIARPQLMSDPPCITPTALQTIIGIGWHLLNGNVESKILTIHPRRFAELLQKPPCTSTLSAISRSLDELEELEMITAIHHASTDSTEIHLSQTYLDLIAQSPWFYPLKDIKTDIPLAINLKWLASFDGGKETISFAPYALAAKVGIKYRRPSELIESVKAALKEIPWLKIAEASKERVVFATRRRGAVPIHSLRRSLQDALDSAQ